MRHLIDLMLADRIVNGRFDSFRISRGKKDIDTLIMYCNIIEQESKKTRASRELCREHPCTDIELIEESFDSNPWLCVYSLCDDVMLMNVLFLVMKFLCICCVCDFMFRN